MSLRALSSGVSGLQANQAALDVIGNNIANVNTPGFKSSRTVFSDLLSQTVAGAQAPGTGSGGRDPAQVGLGSTLTVIMPVFTQGAVQSTGSATDLAIQGDGFFVLKNNANTLYARAGAFTIDAAGVLVDSVTGFKVQGTAGDITIAPGATTPANKTSTAFFGGNLDASQADGTTYVMTYSVNDSLGASHALTLTFTKNFAGAAGRWDWAVTESDANITSLAGATGQLVFNSSGAVTSGGSPSLSITYGAAAGGATPQAITLDFGSASNTKPMTGYAASSTAALARQDGYTAGSLTGFSISADGSISGTFDNGRTNTIGQLILANFSNSGGLTREGQNLWRESVNSGTPAVGRPGTGGRGSLLPGSIEGSNVDLAREFTELITTQRGFEASARIIRVGDEILQTVVNIKQ
jgi:flagellar hook protein FlgE